jgi:hypothetical protein
MLFWGGTAIDIYGDISVANFVSIVSIDRPKVLFTLFDIGGSYSCFVLNEIKRAARELNIQAIFSSFRFSFKLKKNSWRRRLWRDSWSSYELPLSTTNTQSCQWLNRGPTFLMSNWAGSSWPCWPRMRFRSFATSAHLSKFSEGTFSKTIRYIKCTIKRLGRFVNYEKGLFFSSCVRYLRTGWWGH